MSNVFATPPPDAMRLVRLAALPLLLLGACGGGSTTPPPPDVLQVAGLYSGTRTFTTAEGTCAGENNFPETQNLSLDILQNGTTLAASMSSPTQSNVVLSGVLDGSHIIFGTVGVGVCAEGLTCQGSPPLRICLLGETFEGNVSGGRFTGTFTRTFELTTVENQFLFGEQKVSGTFDISR